MLIFGFKRCELSTFGNCVKFRKLFGKRFFLQCSSVTWMLSDEKQKTNTVRKLSIMLSQQTMSENTKNKIHNRYTAKLVCYNFQSCPLCVNYVHSVKLIVTVKLFGRNQFLFFWILTLIKTKSNLEQVQFSQIFGGDNYSSSLTCYETTYIEARNNLSHVYLPF